MADPRATTLFGGPIVDSRMLIADFETDPTGWPLPLTQLPPATELPEGGTFELFYACWDRFQYLKELGRHTTGTWDSTLPLTPRAVPALLASYFGAVPANYHRMLRIIARGPHYNPDTDPDPNLILTRDDLSWMPQGPLAYAWAGMTSTPYLLDMNMAGAVLSSTPPDPDLLADLRLPNKRTLVLFERPYLLEPDSGWWTDEDKAQAERHDKDVEHLLDASGAPRTQDMFDLRGESFATLLYRHGANIAGVLLFSDETGAMADNICWLAETADDHPDGGKVQLINGNLSQSALAPLVWNIAAATSWAHWSPPDPERTARLPKDLDGLHEAKNKGWFRRLVRNDAAHPVHVIDVRPSTPTTPQGDNEGRTVAPHPRRGHWRSVRIATRDEHGTVIGDTSGEQGTDWHYEGRWVPPVYVNAGKPGTAKERVYRLPSKTLFTSQDS